MKRIIASLLRCRWQGTDALAAATNVRQETSKSNGDQKCPTSAPGVRAGIAVVRGAADDKVLDCGNLAASRPATPTTNISNEVCGSRWTTIARPMAMISATLPSMRSVLLRRSAGLPLRARPQAEPSQAGSPEVQ
jgi:hypothetical protein